MSHYFTNENETLKSNPQAIAFRVHNTDFTCMTDHGVFSKESLDRGTAVLLDYLTINPDYKNALDLGCGYGPIGLVLQKVFHLAVDMVDINERALALCRDNLQTNQVVANVFASDGFSAVTQTYDIIVTNPPIRVGKTKLYELLQTSYDYLNDDGEFVFVMNKKHGAESALKFIQNTFKNVTVIGKKKGFYVIACKK